MAKRRKKRIRRLIIPPVVVALAAAGGMYVLFKGGDKKIGEKINREVSFLVDRVDELASAVRKSRTAPQAPSPVKPLIEPLPEPAAPDKPPLSKPISDKDRARLEEILEDSQAF